MEDNKEIKTVVVNMFAGPCAGKTTCAWAIASELKKQGIEAEYVSEYAKELVWDGKTEMLDGTLKNQSLVIKEQDRRVQRLLGKVQVVVTDSPAIMGLSYLKEHDEEYESGVVSQFKKQNNFNLFINRGKEFQQAGRVHTLSESIALDDEIKAFLKNNDIFYGTYYHHTLDVLVENVIRNYKRVNGIMLEENQKTNENDDMEEE